MDMAKVALRSARQGDGEFAFEVKKAALRDYVRETYGWDEDGQRKLHEQRFRSSAIRIIMYERQDVGLLSTREADDRVQLLQLFLLPEAQGKGIGSHVLSEVLAEARQARRSVVLRVLKSNPWAKAFYERHEFALIGQTETHYMMEAVSQPSHERDG